MGRVKVREEAAKARAKREDTIQKALNAIQAGTMSLRDAESAFMIPYSTLRGRQKGAKPHFAAHSDQQLLTPTDEKSVVRWIQNLENCGFSPRIEHVRQAAELIIRATVGENWITRFLNRHPKLATKLTSPLERSRVEAEDPRIIRDHFAKVKRIMVSKKIQQQNIYNMDEKGFLMGLAERSKVICTYQGRRFKMMDDGNRELLTVIECVSADGRVLPSLIIYKGANHYMGWHKFTGQDTESKAFRFTYSPKGWTDRALSLDWVENIFDLHTQDIAKEEWRMLILDGHYSHVTMEFMEYCDAHQIALYCLPPHSTHILQPLDVGLFGPLQHHYSKAVDDYVRRGVYGIHKGNFLPIYLQARQATYMQSSIMKAFETCGLYPFNPRVVLNKLQTTQQILRTEIPPAAIAANLPPPTPKNSSQITRLVRQQKLLLAQETNSEAREHILENLVDLLSRFGIARERDQQLVQQTFEQWQAANSKNTGHDGRHLGKKELKLGRILDGQEIASLYQAREEADLKKAAKKAAQEAAKHQRAQTSKLRKSAAKTSHQRHPTKRSRTKPQKAASPIDIPSDSSSYYEIENESDDGSESPILTTPALPPPPNTLTPGPSTNPRTPHIQRQLSGMPPPSIGGVRRSLRFRK